MSKSYHTLLVKYDGDWSIEFGSYEREDVVDEKDTYGEGYECQIITTGDAQADVDAVVNELNWNESVGEVLDMIPEESK